MSTSGSEAGYRTPPRRSITHQGRRAEMKSPGPTGLLVLYAGSGLAEPDTGNGRLGGPAPADAC
jgi:hypothetical protein